MQVRRVEPVVAGDGHRGVGQGSKQGAGGVAADARARCQHDHGGATGSAHGRLQGIAGAEGLDRAHDLVGEDSSGLRSGHGQHLPVPVRVGRQRFERGQQALVLAVINDDDADARRCRLVEPRRHGLEGAVMDHVARDEVGSASRAEAVRRTVIDHAPASRLDAGLELVGSGPVTLEARQRAFLGKRLDLRGC